MPGPLDLNDLPSDVAARLTAAVAGAELALVRGGAPVGSLTFRPHVAEGTVVGSAPGVDTSAPEPGSTGDVTVVATAMDLSDAARARLAQELGGSFVVVDIREAPDTADILLLNPVSTNLIGLLRRQFPQARVIVTEIDDPELGVSYPGPVSKLLDAGASTYLPPRPVAHVAAGVLAHLEEVAAGELRAGGEPPRAALR